MPFQSSPSCPTRDAPTVTNDRDFRGAHFIRFNRWLISPCARGTTGWRLSVCFSLSSSLSTGNFHVVNEGIDSGSALVCPQLSLSSEEKTGMRSSRKFDFIAWGNVINGSNVTGCFQEKAPHAFLIWFDLSGFTRSYYTQILLVYHSINYKVIASFGQFRIAGRGWERRSASSAQKEEQWLCVRLSWLSPEDTMDYSTYK